MDTLTFLDFFIVAVLIAAIVCLNRFAPTDEEVYPGLTPEEIEKKKFEDWPDRYP